jgi:hypothetical protein
VGSGTFEQDELIYKKLIKVLTSVKPIIIEIKIIFYKTPKYCIYIILLSHPSMGTMGLNCFPNTPKHFQTTPHANVSFFYYNKCLGHPKNLVIVQVISLTPIWIPFGLQVRKHRVNFLPS